MARTKEFQREVALDAAIAVFREHGFAASSAEMLTSAMHIGRQSLYDTFGDKWKLYCAAVERYSLNEVHRHITALKQGTTALEGLRHFLDRVVMEAHLPCLGVGSICEFGSSRLDLMSLRAKPGQLLSIAIAEKVKASQLEGDLAKQLDPEQASSFLLANVSAIRLAARGGASAKQLVALADFALRALQ